MPVFGASSAGRFFELISFPGIWPDYKPIGSEVEAGLDVLEVKAIPVTGRPLALSQEDSPQRRVVVERDHNIIFGE